MHVKCDWIKKKFLGCTTVVIAIRSYSFDLRRLSLKFFLLENLILIMKIIIIKKKKLKFKN